MRIEGVHKKGYHLVDSTAPSHKLNRLGSQENNLRYHNRTCKMCQNMTLEEPCTRQCETDVRDTARKRGETAIAKWRKGARYRVCVCEDQARVGLASWECAYHDQHSRAEPFHRRSHHHNAKSEPSQHGGWFRGGLLCAFYTDCSTFMSDY